jgi:hypothetical protein
MWDIYLGGLSEPSWRAKFKSEISPDISIFDPMVENYETFSEHQRANERAHQFVVMQNECTVIVFYLNDKWKGHSTLLEIGDAVGRGIQVILCLDGKVKDAEKIQRYCEYHGVLVVNSLDDLITTVEEYMAELSLVLENGV